MGTPESELESKYFIEGEAHARGGPAGGFLLGKIIFVYR
jgi:hypothetical protein